MTEGQAALSSFHWALWRILQAKLGKSEARKFSYQPIRKLETIQMFALLSLSVQPVLFTSLASLELLCM